MILKVRGSTVIFMVELNRVSVAASSCNCHKKELKVFDSHDIYDELLHSSRYLTPDFDPRETQVWFT